MSKKQLTITGSGDIFIKIKGRDYTLEGSPYDIEIAPGNYTTKISWRNVQAGFSIKLTESNLNYHGSPSAGDNYETRDIDFRVFNMEGES